MLVKFTSFLSTLRWPEGLNDLGKFGLVCLVGWPGFFQVVLSLI